LFIIEIEESDDQRRQVQFIIVHG